MSDTKFTPGPWRAERGSTTSVISDATGRPVWLLQNDNASLIAAAPDLYEALRECDDFLVGLNDEDTNMTLVMKIRAALAKARGET